MADSTERPPPPLWGLVSQRPRSQDLFPGSGVFPARHFLSGSVGASCSETTCILGVAVWTLCAPWPCHPVRLAHQLGLILRVG